MCACTHVACACACARYVTRTARGRAGAPAAQHRTARDAGGNTQSHIRHRATVLPVARTRGRTAAALSPRTHTHTQTSAERGSQSLSHTPPQPPQVTPPAPLPPPLSPSVDLCVVCVEHAPLLGTLCVGFPQYMHHINYLYAKKQKRKTAVPHPGAHNIKKKV